MSFFGVSGVIRERTKNNISTSKPNAFYIYNIFILPDLRDEYNNKIIITIDVCYLFRHPYK